MRILFAEDVRKLASFVKRGLEAQSYTVDCVFDGVAAEQRALSDEYDLIVLDIMLPGKDGLDVCRAVREQGIHAPILMLTARGTIEDRVTGLNQGADDYLVKPFDFKELSARVRALLRRPRGVQSDVYTIRDITVDTAAQSVSRGGVRINLSLKEYAVLEYLCRNSNIALSRDRILEHCWGWDYDSFSNIVDVYIRKLRQKLDPANPEKHIKTVRGVGYRLEQ